MEISRYKKPIIIFIVYCAFATALLLFMDIVLENRSAQDLSPLIPGTGFLETVILLLILFPISAIIGIFFGYLLAPLYLFAHKKTIGIRMIYGVQEVPQSEEFKKTFLALFPALMAINFSLMIAFNRDIAATIVGDIEGFALFLVAFILIIIVTLAISMALFAPAWFLSDAGIMFSNKKKVESGKEQPVEGRSVGSWYIYLLKGYAGISVIFAYYQFITQFLSSIAEEGGDFTIPLIINVILLFPLMIFLAIASIPALILLDITKNHRVNYVRKWAEKMGIIDNVKVTFEKI
jgi:hypothetical protein